MPLWLFPLQLRRLGVGANKMFYVLYVALNKCRIMFLLLLYLVGSEIFRPFLYQNTIGIYSMLTF